MSVISILHGAGANFASDMELLILINLQIRLPTKLWRGFDAFFVLRRPDIAARWTPRSLAVLSCASTGQHAWLSLSRALGKEYVCILRDCTIALQSDEASSTGHRNLDGRTFSATSAYFGGQATASNS